jgi:hypothetical protein
MKFLIPFFLALPAVFAAFQGKATFYQIQPNSVDGACSLERNFNGIPLTVAMNKNQYQNGDTCGKCVSIQGSGIGIGTTPLTGSLFATIDNECPECKFGDIDLGMYGDGIWDITWDFVPCHRRLRGNNIFNKTGHYSNITSMDDCWIVYKNCLGDIHCEAMELKCHPSV